ncbi:HalD/BesD family halogenase [Burkholderia sp. TSV86]|uniref:HalD/BesD family halogenase n=1 Tax=Burkholderia sp. TSV86 TaxID=1385594 RepID=UPI00075E6C8D|nr:hypothetical protein [Burkholderia sp. TSV86]KVE35537.1 hypothetical protein WS68_06180 [Burkholderia sp. TSV86]
MDNRFLFGWLVCNPVASRYLDQNVVRALAEDFESRGYVKLPGFFEADAFEFIKREVERIQEVSIRREFTMPGYNTPRRLSVIGGDRIVDESIALAMLYGNSALRDVVTKIAQRPVFFVRHQTEFMVANYLESFEDTHGWHLDDPQFALVVILESPARDKGGNVEIIRNWQTFCTDRQLDPDGDIEKGVALANAQAAIEVEHHEAGDCYLLNAGACLHRVTPIARGTRRKALNLAYDIDSRREYGRTADLLYGAA